MIIKAYEVTDSETINDCLEDEGKTLKYLSEEIEKLYNDYGIIMGTKEEDLVSIAPINGQMEYEDFRKFLKSSKFIKKENFVFNTDGIRCNTTFSFYTNKNIVFAYDIQEGGFEEIIINKRFVEIIEE